MTQNTADSADRRSILTELMQSAQLAWNLLTDPRVSLMSKTLIPLAGVVYFLVPIDLLPDFLPGLGQLDDLAMILILVRLFISLAPKDVVAEYRAGMGRDTGTARAGFNTPAGSTTSGSTGDREDDVVDAEYRVVDDE